MWEQPGGMLRVGIVEELGSLGMEMGVPEREADAEDGFVGDTEPPLERCDELKASFVGEEEVEEGMLADM